MKRSDINAAIRRALLMLEKNNLRLPPFGYWTPEEWRRQADETGDLRRVMLGWDVTDFGVDDFARTGAILFTLRNGSPDDPATGTPYAEKLMFMEQETQREIPFHFHVRKTEDIINRGGGMLAIQLYNSAPDGGLDEAGPVRVRMDGLWRMFPAGAVVEIEKGGSVTLHPGLYHRFWGKKGCGDLVAGEVSSVNDDRTDNVFLRSIARFSSIEEDEPALYPLCNEV